MAIEDTEFLATPFSSQTGKTFGSSQWQVSFADIEFAETVYDSAATSPLLQDNGAHVVPFTQIYITNGIYYWRVRYRSSDGIWSAWSNPAEFEIIVLPS